MFDIPAAITASANTLTSIITRIWPDATEVEKAKLAQLTAEANATWTSLLAQIEINKIEASSPSIFVSGWRPFIGWTCGFALAYSSILEPLLRFIAQVALSYTSTFPVVDTTITLQILLALLGLGAYRTYEKTKQIS